MRTGPWRIGREFGTSKDDRGMDLRRTVGLAYGPGDQDRRLGARRAVEFEDARSKMCSGPHGWKGRRRVQLMPCT